MRIIGKNKKRFLDKDISEILGAEFVSTTGGILGGLLLITLLDKLYLLPGLLIILPGFLETHGNILGSMAARIGTALHTKKLKPKGEHSRYIKSNTYATILEALILGTILGLIAYLITYLVFKVHSPYLILVSLLAVILAIAIEIPLVIAATFWMFRQGYDPDDIMGPYVTTLGDVLGIASLLFAMAVLL